MEVVPIIIQIFPLFLFFCYEAHHHKGISVWGWIIGPGDGFPLTISDHVGSSSQMLGPAHLLLV